MAAWQAKAEASSQAIAAGAGWPRAATRAKAYQREQDHGHGEGMEQGPVAAGPRAPTRRKWAGVAHRPTRRARDRGPCPRRGCFKSEIVLPHVPRGRYNGRSLCSVPEGGQRCDPARIGRRRATCGSCPAPDTAFSCWRSPWAGPSCRPPPAGGSWEYSAAARRHRERRAVRHRQRLSSSPLAALCAQNAGMQWNRWEFRWDNIERARGHLDWGGSDEVVEASTGRGPEGAGHPRSARLAGRRRARADGVIPRGLYEPWDSPRNTWGRFVRTIAERYRGRVQAWEIWNEPDYPQRRPSASGSAARPTTTSFSRSPTGRSGPWTRTPPC